MRAVQCVEWGAPDKLVVAELPAPEPAPGEVRIRVAAAGVNFPDALIVQKKYQVQPPLPFTPGTEVAGTIDAVGSEVRNWKVGARVVAFVGTGGFAEYVCTAVANVAPVPPGVADETAAAFTLTYATSHHALFDRGQLGAGETLLVLGAGGGVGLAAVELGHLRGATVIAAASSPDKLAAARSRGAAETINYRQEDLRDAVKRLTHGRGVDVIYDPVGGSYTDAAVRSLAWRGRLLVVGFADGTIPSIAANWLLIKGSAAVGVFWGDFTRREPEKNQAMLAELFGWLAAGRLKPEVTRSVSLEQVPEALNALLARQVVGKWIVVPSR
jgi:NADPH:quinone reductase